MAEFVQEYLDQIGNGEVTAMAVADKVAELVLKSPSVTERAQSSEQYFDALHVKDRDDTNSWLEVSEAKEAGQITPEQYGVLLEAYRKAHAAMV